VAQGLQHLCSKCEALSSNPSAIKNKKQKKKIIESLGSKEALQIIQVQWFSNYFQAAESFPLRNSCVDIWDMKHTMRAALISAVTRTGPALWVLLLWPPPRGLFMFRVLMGLLTCVAHQLLVGAPVTGTASLCDQPQLALRAFSLAEVGTRYIFGSGWIGSGRQ
jgi:hypothetical protein